MGLKKKPIFIVLFLLFLLTAFIFISWFFSNIFIYVVISLVLATILRPLTNYLSNQQFFSFRMPRALAVFISFCTLIGILSILVVLFFPLISEQVKIIPKIARLDQVMLKVQEPMENVEEFLIENQIGSLEKGFLEEKIKASFLEFVKEIDVSNIIENIISLTGNFFVGLMAVAFITFFLLYEKGLWRKQLINIIPNAYFEVSIAGLYKIEKLLSNYMLGLLFQMTAIFTIAFTGLSILGVKYAASIALFAAIINLIPYLGPILGAVFGIIVGLSTSGSQIFDSNAYLLLMIKIISVFGIVQLTDNIFLQPLIFSKSIKAHPLEIFIIIFAGATLAGVVGMIVAIPAYTILRVFIMEIYNGYRSYHIFKS